jgi:hypothetical protein
MRWRGGSVEIPKVKRKMIGGDDLAANTLLDLGDAARLISLRAIAPDQCQSAGGCGWDRHEPIDLGKKPFVLEAYRTPFRRVRIDSLLVMK